MIYIGYIKIKGKKCKLYAREIDISDAGYELHQDMQKENIYDATLVEILQYVDRSYSTLLESPEYTIMYGNFAFIDNELFMLTSMIEDIVNTISRNSCDKFLVAASGINMAIYIASIVCHHSIKKIDSFKANRYAMDTVRKFYSEYLEYSSGL